jgi:hypothetical protein
MTGTPRRRAGHACSPCSAPARTHAPGCRGNAGAVPGAAPRAWARGAPVDGRLHGEAHGVSLVPDMPEPATSELLAAGESVEDMLAEYPHLESDDIAASLLYAARQLDHPVVAA